MARTKTTKSATEQSTVQEVAPVSVPSTTVSVKSKKSTKSADASVAVASKVPAVKSVVAPVDADVSEVANVDTDESSLNEQSMEFLAKLQQINSMIGTLKADYRVLEKKWTRELKSAQKLNSKRKRKSGNRAPSGFVKPTRISDELAKFLEKPAGSEMARTEVTRDINKYIRTNNLQDAKNGRKINPDAKLATLLKIKKNDELTYFNLQRYMSPHFAKATPPQASSASA
jgi:upstream activation factor subunit UAF30